MAKVQIKSEKLTPFGGIFSIMEQFDSMFSSVIDSTLGQRCTTSIGYQFSEIVGAGTHTCAAGTVSITRRICSTAETLSTSCLQLPLSPSREP